jgi:hypothetical protein
MPYPWFDRQAKHPGLYPGVKFPDASFPGVSTHKSDEGNGRLLENFVLANWNEFGGGSGEERGIFLDMQAVDETHLGSRGAWRGRFVLVPHGALYRVRLEPNKQQQASKRPPGLALCALWQAPAIEALTAMRRTWITAASTTRAAAQPAPGGVLRVPANTTSHGYLGNLSHILDDEEAAAVLSPAFEPIPGSWEFAALSVYFDAHYQLALFFLTYALDLQEGITAADLPDLVRSLASAALLLDHVVHSALREDKERTADAPHSKLPIVEPKVSILSSARKDVVKNCALAHLRLQAAVGVAAKNPALLQVPPPSHAGETEGDELMAVEIQVVRKAQKLLDYSIGQRVVAAEGTPEKVVTRAAVEAVARFLAQQPQDRDAPVFRAALAQYKTALTDTPKSSASAGSSHQTAANDPGRPGYEEVRGSMKKKRRKKKQKPLEPGAEL